MGAETKKDLYEQLARWLIPALATIAFTVSGWFFNRLDSSLDRLNNAVSGLNRKVDVLEDARERNRDIRDRLSRIEALVDTHQRDGHAARSDK